MLNHVKCGPFDNKKTADIRKPRKKKQTLISDLGGFNIKQSVARRASNTLKKTPLKTNVRK